MPGPSSPLGSRVRLRGDPDQRHRRERVPGPTSLEAAMAQASDSGGEPPFLTGSPEGRGERAAQTGGGALVPAGGKACTPVRPGAGLRPAPKGRREPRPGCCLGAGSPPAGLGGTGRPDPRVTRRASLVATTTCSPPSAGPTTARAAPASRAAQHRGGSGPGPQGAALAAPRVDTGVRGSPLSVRPSVRPSRRQGALPASQAAGGGPRGRSVPG